MGRIALGAGRDRSGHSRCVVGESRCPVGFTIVTGVVAVRGADQGAVSRRGARALDATAAVHLIERRADGRDPEGILLRGEAYGVVILPAGLPRARERSRRAPGPRGGFHPFTWAG